MTRRLEYTPVRHRLYGLPCTSCGKVLLRTPIAKLGGSCMKAAVCGRRRSPCRWHYDESEPLWPLHFLPGGGHGLGLGGAGGGCGGVGCSGLGPCCDLVRIEDLLAELHHTLRRPWRFPLLSREIESRHNLCSSQHLRRSKCKAFFTRPGSFTVLSVKICSRVRCTWCRFFVRKYQSMVRCRPSMNFTCGSQPSSFRARELSATRFIGPVGISGCSSILGLCPV